MSRHEPILTATLDWSQAGVRRTRGCVPGVATPAESLDDFRYAGTFESLDDFRYAGTSESLDDFRYAGRPDNFVENDDRADEPWF